MTKGKSGLKRLTIAEQRALGRGEQLESSFEADDRNGAIIYARVSSDDSAKSNLSIPDQLKQSRKLCDRNAWQILNEYVDEGRSAFLEEVVRPQFEKMIADVETGLYPTLKYVVFYHSSRLARRTEVF
jgi:DNA invertase Pin-like site-specific DNA recombinase